MSEIDDDTSKPLGIRPPDPFIHPRICPGATIVDCCRAGGGATECRTPAFRNYLLVFSAMCG